MPMWRWHFITEGKHVMYAVTGITGKVGGALAHTLLAANQSVSFATPRKRGSGPDADAKSPLRA
jgi:uncharacterized protein YbjT (DUF2867 family)